MGVQKDNFMAVADNISGRRNLGAEVDTTNLFGSITSRFTRDLTFLASWSREDRDDDTPVVVYNTGYTNNPESTTKDFGKLELAYRLPAGFKITGGVDYDQREYKGLYEDGLRDEVNERTYRVDLKKSLSETISGKVQYSRSERTGSPWMSAYVTSGQPLGAYYAGSIQFSDRTRDKLKFFADFAPTEALNIQAAYEMSDDEYDNRTPYNGAKSGAAELYSLDAAYQFSDDWRASAWYSYSTNRVSYIKANANNTPTVISWAGKADLKGDAFGLDVSGKVLRKFDVGLQYTHSNDTGDYPMAWDNPATTTPIGVPDTEYKLDRLRLYGKYPVAKNSVLRADYIYDVRRMDDYTWKNWIYSDGTTVFVDPKQTTQIFALTLIHKF